MLVGGGFRRAAGWLFLLVPFIPLRWIFDDPPGTTWLPSPYEWVLGIFIFATVAWLAARIFPEFVERASSAVGALLRTPSDRAFRVGALGLIAVLLVAASIIAFSQRPLLIDSIIQLFQGKIFAQGDAWVAAPELEAFFTTQHMVSDAGRWYSQYPPGHPGAMTLGVWIGAPWLIPIVFSLLSAFLIIDIARRLFGEHVARVTAVLTILSSFFWFMGASYMNHVTSLVSVSMFVWCFVRWAGDGATESQTPGPTVWLLAAGLALGAAFLTRPLTALAVGTALAIPALKIAGRRWWSAALMGLGGFVALASLYFAFNAATTGDPFTAGYLKLWGEEHGLGFHASPWGDSHTPLTGLRNELIDLGLLNGFLFEWPIPALLPLGILLAAGWSATKWEGRLLGAFFAIPAAYFFYWHRDAFLGPRYLYEGLPFLLPLLALSYVELGTRLREREIRWLAGVNAWTFAAALIAVSFLYSLGFGIPQRYRIYATGMESVKQDLLAEAAAAGVDEGLIFIKVSWGNRMIARARGLGASASVAERVYRRSDHCEMELLVSTAEQRAWSGERLDQELISIIRPEDEVEMVRINEDPTLRLVPGRALAPACAREVIYDRDGQEQMPMPPTYSNYSPHLVANAPDLGGPLVFARDLRELNAELRARYPDLPAYLYRGREFVPLP